MTKLRDIIFDSYYKYNFIIFKPHEEELLNEEFKKLVNEIEKVYIIDDFEKDFEILSNYDLVILPKFSNINCLRLGDLFLEGKYNKLVMADIVVPQKIFSSNIEVHLIDSGDFLEDIDCSPLVISPVNSILECLLKWVAVTSYLGLPAPISAIERMLFKDMGVTHNDCKIYIDYAICKNYISVYKYLFIQMKRNISREVIVKEFKNYSNYYNNLINLVKTIYEGNSFAFYANDYIFRLYQMVSIYELHLIGMFSKK